MATSKGWELSRELASLAGVTFPEDPPLAARWVAGFQSAFMLDRYQTHPLKPDGDPGTLTAQAMAMSVAAGGLLSRNFALAEFRNGGSTTITASNRGAYVTRAQLAALQRLRDVIAEPLYLVSTYRDPSHNRAVGGVRNSLHLTGEAADIDRPRTGPRITERLARAVGFVGVGMVSERDPEVVHVDTRYVSGRWFYQ